MTEDHIATTAQTTMPSTRAQGLSQGAPGERDALPDRPPPQTHRLFRALWLAVNGLLILSVFLAMYATGWEYSTRRYLTGFSDAIVPATAPGEEKINAVLNWMAHGPARRSSSPSGVTSDRDPTDTLNYYALLQVCGTATNAFLNLLNTGNIEVRRLLLLDSRRLTQHVVAEVLVDGRWIVVDPAFRVVLRTPDGKALTSKELSDPAILAEATQRIPHYDPSYTFEHTTHIRMARMPLLGIPLQRILDRLMPGWDAWPVMTLLVERESFAAMVSAVLLVIFLLLLRIAIRWYGERHLEIQPMRIRKLLHQLYRGFLNPSAGYRNRVDEA
jgi:hypothetical protein